MSKRFNVDWDKIGLGERNDCEIADEVGCTRYAVLQQRRKRGIASCEFRRRLKAVDAAIAAFKGPPEEEYVDRGDEAD
jgi:hypothetical protein